MIFIEYLLFAAIPNYPESLNGPSVVQQNTDDPEYVGVCVCSCVQLSRLWNPYGMYDTGDIDYSYT